MTQDVNYEVQVQQGGRWSIHARFDGAQKEAAVDEGKELDKLSNVEAVRVIKEVFDPVRETHNEFIIYKTPQAKGDDSEDNDDSKDSRSSSRSSRDQRSSRSKRSTTYDDGDNEEVTPRRHKKGKKKKTTTLTAIIVKLLMVILFSLVIAAMFAAMADSFLAGTNLFGVRMVGNAESNMLIGVFVVTFLISAVGIAVTIMRGQRLDSSPGRKPIVAPARQPKPPPQKPAFRKLVPDLPTGTTTGPDDAAMNGIDEFKVPSEDKTAEDEAKTAEDEAKKVLDQATNERLQAEINPDNETSQEAGLA